jgi:flagellar export protein FliJ
VTDLKTWQTLVDRAEHAANHAEEAARAARAQWARAQDRLERTAALLASAQRPEAMTGSADFIQFRAYQQKLQQLRARLEREAFVLSEDLMAEERALGEARETLRRYRLVLERTQISAEKAREQQEQKAMDATALARFLSARRAGDLAGGLS